MTLELLNDPEIAKAATDPEGMAVIQDVTWLQFSAYRCDFFPSSPDMTVCINQGDDGSCQYQVAQRQSKSIESRRKVGLLIALERRVTNHGMWRIMSQPVSEEI